MADKNIVKYASYITNDIGKNVSYRRAQTEYDQKSFDAALRDIKTQYQTELANLGKQGDFPGLGVPYAQKYQAEFKPIPDYFKPFTNNYNEETASFAIRNQLQNYTQQGKARLTVPTITLETNPNYTQTHLSNEERNDWATELRNRVKYIAELDSLREEADANTYNALLPETKLTYRNKSRIFQDRMGLSTNTPKIKYIGTSETHNPYPMQYKNIMDNALKRINSTGIPDLTSDEIDKLQYYYDNYGIAPQYKFLPQREIDLLDHLHAAGYAYTEKPKTFTEATSKLSDALSRKFTNRTLDGYTKGQSLFTTVGERAILTNHLNNRGENIGNKFNKSLKSPMFEISPSAAYDYTTGKYNIALAEKNPSKKYKLFTDVLKPHYNNIINSEDINPTLVNTLTNIGFRDPNIINFRSQLTTNRPTKEEFESGRRSAGKFVTSQKSNMGNPNYGAGRIQGVSYIQGKPA